jgi:hypothetical protein
MMFLNLRGLKVPKKSISPSKCISMGGCAPNELRLDTECCGYRMCITQPCLACAKMAVQL